MGESPIRVLSVERPCRGLPSAPPHWPSASAWTASGSSGSTLSSARGPGISRSTWNRVSDATTWPISASSRRFRPSRPGRDLRRGDRRGGAGDRHARHADADDREPVADRLGIDGVPTFQLQSGCSGAVQTLTSRRAAGHRPVPDRAGHRRGRIGKHSTSRPTWPRAARRPGQLRAVRGRRRRRRAHHRGPPRGAGGPAVLTRLSGSDRDPGQILDGSGWRTAGPSRRRRARTTRPSRSPCPSWPWKSPRNCWANSAGSGTRSTTCCRRSFPARMTANYRRAAGLPRPRRSPASATPATTATHFPSSSSTDCCPRWRRAAAIAWPSSPVSGSRAASRWSVADDGRDLAGGVRGPAPGRDRARHRRRGSGTDLRRSLRLGLGAAPGDARPAGEAPGKAVVATRFPEETRRRLLAKRPGGP